jgi:hypothetical protein
MNKAYPLLLLLGALIISVSSCTEDYFEFEKFKVDPIKPEIAIPLINSSLTPRDIFLSKETPNIITTDQNGLISIVFEKGGFEVNTTDLFQLQDQSYTEAIGFTATEIGAFPIQGSISKTFRNTYNFANPGGVRVDSILIKSGLLNLNISSDLRHGGSVKVTFPSFIENGIPLSFDLELNYSGTTPVISSQNKNLANYSLEVDNTNGNTIPVIYEVTFNYSGNAISPQDSIRFAIATNNLEFQSFYGFAGQQSINFRLDTLPLEFFDGVVSGNFYSAAPKLTINAVNQFGIPIEVDFDRFDAKTINSGTFPVQLPQNPIAINAPNVIGDSAVTVLILDPNNSNMDNVVSSLPTDFIFKFSAHTNPNSTTVQNFLLENSKATVDIKFELPLIGTVSNYLLIDTLDFEFDNTQLLDAATFRTIISNGFPVDADVQIYFADGNFRVIDSLFNGQQQIITSGIINNEGVVIQPTKEIMDTKVDKAGLTNLFRSSKIIIKADLSTSNDGSSIVQFYDDYRLEVKLGMKASFDLDFE